MSVFLKICLIPLLAIACVGQSTNGSRPIRLGVTVESEGPNGLWAQSGVDLSKSQIAELETLIRGELSKQQDILLVPKDDPNDIVGLSVVVERIGKPNEPVSYIASAALVISKKGGDDLFVTHDVISGPDLPSVAKSVAFYFASMRLRLTLGMLNTPKN
ncbi:MAG: hypothetical protein WBL97_20635 [Candidatus Sulfotelmatobacter sp.]